MADQYLGTPVSGERLFVYNCLIMRFIQKKKEIMDMVAKQHNVTFQHNCASFNKSTNFGTQVVEHFLSKTRSAYTANLAFGARCANISR